ncbi:MAG: hypothetical protein EZS28_034034 [Streblomastix strix]|uniref:Uncharacterized protein n=1 Tax=Streblomastix strix TaxID=222440 RepID=A0A5J4UIN6_9EUKA|nr:MAG: hypothetical protein EZS28_034034 [Streblomastix strix]
MGIQNRTKEEIHTLEIFPRIQMEEILQHQPDMGMGGKTIRYLEAWKLVKGVQFMQKGFFFLFKSKDSEMRLQEKLRICPSSGSKEEETAYTEKLDEELRENIIEQIHPKQAKWFNPTFIIPKPHQKCRKIPDASTLNKEIQTIHFKMNGTDQSERFDEERRLGNKFRSKISLSPPNSISTTQTIPSIRSNGESLLIQSNALRNAALPNLLRTSTSNGSNEDMERVRYKNFELRRRSAPPTLEQ